MFKVTLATVFAPVDAARQMHVPTCAHFLSRVFMMKFVQSLPSHANAVNIKCIVEITSIRQS